MTGFWIDKRVFITGASGLLGSWLTRSLVEKGAYVVVLLRDCDPQTELVRSGMLNGLHVVNGALEDYASLERAINEHEVDTVFHLGAQTIVGTANRNPLPTFESNIRGTYHLLEACRYHGSLVKRVLVASSDKAYGTSAILPYTENMPLEGRHPYDVSKTCTDLIAQSYFHTYRLPVVIARCGNIYGGGDLNWSRIIPGTILSLFRNQRPIVRSDGSYTRDYVFVMDAVDAYLAMAEAVSLPAIQGQAFNFGPAKPLTVLEIIALLTKLMGKEHLSPEIQNTAKSEIQDQYLLSTKAQELLGWSPRFSLEQGLMQTISWYENYFKSYKSQSILPGILDKMIGKALASKAGAK